MKTQQECWQALIDGETLVSRVSGNEYRMVDGGVRGPHAPVSFANPSDWSIKPKKLPFCDALRALVAGECEAIERAGSYTMTLTSRIEHMSPCDFDHEWELIK